MTYDENIVERYKDMISQNRVRLLERIAKVRNPDTVELVAVTKAKPIEVAIAAHQLDITELAENYAGELVDKVTHWPTDTPTDPAPDAATNNLAKPTASTGELQTGPSWHFIGQLQSNKVRQLAPYVSLWQSVDRIKLVNEIAKRAPGADVLLQVNLSDDVNKGGCERTQLDALFTRALEVGLNVRGLMGVGVADDVYATEIGFSWLREKTSELNLEHCSIGMSGDLELALKHGSTMCRIGSALLGERL